MGILSFVALLLRSFQSIATFSDAMSMLCCALALPLGYYMADFLSGLIHWVCDSFGDSNTPLWGPMLVAPFRRHHKAPADITHISLTENLGASALVGSFVLWWWSPRVVHGSSGWTVLLYAAGLWCIAFAVVSNRFHRWAHLPLARRPYWMQCLQRWRIVLKPQDHAIHHRKPHRNNYCILSGWANPLCNRVPWQLVESWLARVGIRTNFD